MAVLIILVVFGHACQFLIFPQNTIGFKLIYTFHMPAFVFLTGICSKPGEPKKVIRRFLLPHVVFQILYNFYLKVFIDPETVFTMITPIRHLWYLLSVAIWKSFLPLFDTKDRKKQLLFVAAAVLAALRTGGPFILMPEKKVPPLSTLGTRTMPVFMFHMAVMLLLNKHREEVPQQLWFPVLVSAACVIIFAQKPFVWLTSPLTELEKLRQKKERTEKHNPKTSERKKRLFVKCWGRENLIPENTGVGA